MRVILTDVTYMHDGICIAGWSQEEERMIRPVLPGGAHWAMEADLFQVGNILEFEPVRDRGTGILPHTTEDYVVKAHPQLIETMEAEDMIDQIDNTFSSPEVLFRNNLLERKFVLEGANCPSLGAIDIDATNIEFTEDNYERKRLKCTFDSGGNQYWNIPVTGVDLRDFWLENGVAALNEMAHDADQAYIRLGLARGYEKQGQRRCYMQVNNVLFY